MSLFTPEQQAQYEALKRLKKLAYQREKMTSYGCGILTNSDINRVLVKAIQDEGIKKSEFVKRALLERLLRLGYITEDQAASEE